MMIAIIPRTETKRGVHLPLSQWCILNSTYSTKFINFPHISPKLINFLRFFVQLTRFCLIYFFCLPLFWPFMHHALQVLDAPGNEVYLLAYFLAFTYTDPGVHQLNSFRATVVKIWHPIANLTQRLVWVWSCAAPCEHDRMSTHAVHAFSIRVGLHGAFIHSFIQDNFTTQRRSRHSTDTVPEFHTEAPQSTASEGLAQGPYVAARAGFKAATLRMKGDEFTNESPRLFEAPCNGRTLALSDKHANINQSIRSIHARLQLKIM